MRGHTKETLFVAAAIILAIAVFCAGASYFVEYQEWDDAAASYVYRERPLAGAVFALAVMTSAAILFAGALVAFRLTRWSASTAGRAAISDLLAPR